MKRILLVNPPIYDFTAYDFWLKPLGMLTAASRIDQSADFSLFDFLDRFSPLMPASNRPNQDPYNRGPYNAKIIDKPEAFKSIPRHFRRFGIERAVFQQFLADSPPHDIIMIQTTMTYWYLGIKEVIEDIRSSNPNATIVLGGFYASLLPIHAKSLGADITISNDDLSSLANLLRSTSSPYLPPLWNLYPTLKTAVMTLTIGCPFKCTYCATPQMNRSFQHRQLNECIADLQNLINKGVTDIAFYDDALLYQPQKLLVPFLKHIINSGINVNLHSPNALHARFMSRELAQLMVCAGFKTFYLGFESSSESFQQQTGAKVVSEDLSRAVDNLISAGASPSSITAYEILGHPGSNLQQLEESIRFANSLKIRVMLSDFSPIPSTPDGEKCRKYFDLEEPLNHNKTAFPITMLGDDKVNYFKNLAKTLNRSLTS